MSALDVERGGLSERELQKRKGKARYDAGTSSLARDSRWFWSRSRGNVWVTGDVVGGSVCVRVRGLRAHCRRGASAVRDAADSTNSSAFSCAGEPAAAEFAGQKIWDELAAKARGRKICVRRRLVWAGANDHESSRVEADSAAETSAVGILRGLKSAW